MGSSVWDQNASDRDSQGFDPTIKRVLDFYYGPCKYCLPVVKADHKHRYHPMAGVSVDADRQRKFAQFRQDGFLEIDKFEINIGALENAAKEAFLTADDGLTVKDVELPELQPIVEDR